MGTGSAVPMKALQDCEYTAFISYAHADDEGWFHWITQFRNELERSLAAMLRGVRLPRLHLSGENGPVAGMLSDELKTRVARSFAMIIVVHDNYAQSDWCLKELEYFNDLYGDEGLRQRLYIVAMSEHAVQTMAQSPAWQRLMPHADQLWMPFFDSADRARPLDIYLAPGLVAPAFRGPFERLRSDLAAKLRQPASAAPAPSPPVLFSSPAPTGQPLPDIVLPPLTSTPPGTTAAPVPLGAVRIYIESNRHERTLWEDIGEQIRSKWDLICQELAPGRVPPLTLRPRGLPVEQIDQYPNLDDADGVVLLWGRKTSEALVAQINKVENKLMPGRDAPPGIVAYLMPPQLSTEPIPAWGWQVLRFNASDLSSIDVVAEERDDLERFLRKVFVRHQQRSQSPLPQRPRGGA